MLVKHWLAIGLLFTFTAAYAAETDDASLEVIEMLGEMGDEAADLDIAMSDVSIRTNEKDALPQEEKNVE